MINDQEQQFVIPGFYCSNITMDSDNKEIIRVMGEQQIKNKPTGRYMLSDGKTKSEDEILTNYTFISQTGSKNMEDIKAEKLKRLMGDFQPIKVKDSEISNTPTDFLEITKPKDSQPNLSRIDSEENVRSIANETYLKKEEECNQLTIENEKLCNEIIILKEKGVSHFDPHLDTFEQSIIDKYRSVNNSTIALNVLAEIPIDFDGVSSAVKYLKIKPEQISEDIVNQMMRSTKFAESLKNVVIRKLTHDDVFEKEEVKEQPQPTTTHQPEEEPTIEETTTDDIESLISNMSYEPQPQPEPIIEIESVTNMTDYDQETVEKIKNIDDYLKSVL